MFNCNFHCCVPLLELPLYQWAGYLALVHLDLVNSTVMFLTAQIGKENR